MKNDDAAAPAGASPNCTIKALPSGEYEFELWLDRDTYENFLAVRELLRDEIPDGDPGAIIERALDTLARARAKQTT